MGDEDGTQAIVGTAFQHRTSKMGNEPLENWLARLLTPHLHFQFCEVSIDGKDVVVLEIPKALSQPVQFRGQEYIRVGSQKKKLKDFPEKERTLWRNFDGSSFEDLIAASSVGADDALQMLDYPAYFELLKRPLPDGKAESLKLSAWTASSAVPKVEAGISRTLARSFSRNAFMTFPAPVAKRCVWWSIRAPAVSRR